MAAAHFMTINNGGKRSDFQAAESASHSIPAGRSSGLPVGLFQKPQIRLIGHAGSRHGLPQVVGLGE